MPGLPIGNYYASLGNKYAYFYAAHCVNENPEVPIPAGALRGKIFQPWIGYYCIKLSLSTIHRPDLTKILLVRM